MSSQYFLSSLFNACLSNCSSEIATYQDTSSVTNYSCQFCSNIMSNCLTCSSSSICNSCENGTYLKSDQSICVFDCLLNDNGGTYR